MGEPQPIDLSIAGSRSELATNLSGFSMLLDNQSGYDPMKISGFGSQKLAIVNHSVRKKQKFVLRTGSIPGVRPVKSWRLMKLKWLSQ